MFAVLVVIVVAAGVIVALKAIRGGGRPLTEDEPVPSRIFAPSGMIPTAAEKEVQKQWDALPKSHRQIGWYWGIIDGRQPLPALRRASRPHPSRRAGLTERDYWRMRHAATDANPQRALLLRPG